MRWLLLYFSLFVQTVLFAQDSTDVAVDTTRHSVKKAVIFSAVLPGSGQIYNHRAMPKGQKKAYWKVPLIFAGLGATGYFALTNNQMKKDLRSEYDSRQAGNPISEQFEQFDDQGLLQLYAVHRTRRDLFLLGFGLVYLLNIADAGVEAHFVHFDVSEELSVSIEPALMQNRYPGIGVRLNFR